ncbi:alpha/beta fold hydrolase [Helicobacter pullorum]|uniref:alpha/beta fold hydrolase n=1 Tax=Helicobacter pullorum TaxID=35818 RepID=UPI00241E3FE1|nr:alpha/beta hydrolase [Helicobacter pullorum]
MAQKTIIYKDCPIDISYEILNFNAPRTLVILHGWGSNKRLMKQAFGESFGDFCHLYIDMPGFGNSSNPTFSMDTFDYAKILEIFLLSLEIQEFVVMGHSFGGKVATLLNPRELILLSSAGILEEKSLKVKSKIVCSKILNKISPSLAKIFKGILRSQDVQNMNEVMYQTFKKVVNEDFSAIFADFKGKAFIFWGKEDRATSLQSGQKIHHLMRNSRFFALEGDHYFFLKQAKKIEELYML